MSEAVTSERRDGRSDHAELDTFLKYCSDNDDVIEGIFEKHKIRFTQPAALNDPLEFRPAIRFKDAGDEYRHFVCKGEILPSEEVWLHIQLVQRQLNAFGILSLTKTPDSFDMWNHYANGHKGFLLEFKGDFNTHQCMCGEDGKVYEVRKVDYVDKYAVSVDDLINADGQIPITEYNEQVFHTKTSRWAQEEEYRMVRALADLPEWRPLAQRAHRDLGLHLFDFCLECLVSVTFGACMTISNKRRIMKACEGTEIQFLQAMIIRGEDDACSVGCVTAGQFPNLLEMTGAELIAEQEYVEERNRQPVAISSLDELPYYVGNEDLVRQYLENRRARLGT